jgi:deazaflavin-dependent oxidoreductase (nitroreductase family)
MAAQEPNPNFLQRSVQRIAATTLGARLLVPTAHRLDEAVLRLSGGRTTAVGLMAGLPVLMLTTVGAKSGQLRTVPLVGIPEGERIVIVASNFGQAHHPAWYHNLKKTPQVTVKMNGWSGDYVAREAKGKEYERLWKKAVALYAGYAAYKTRTGERQIPILVLTPDRTARPGSATHAKP